MPDRLQEIIQQFGGPMVATSGDPKRDLLQALHAIDWLVDALEASRTAGDQLRAILDELITYARHAAVDADRAIVNARLNRLANQAEQYLGNIRSPDEAAQVAERGMP